MDHITRSPRIRLLYHRQSKKLLHANQLAFLSFMICDPLFSPRVWKVVNETPNIRIEEPENRHPSFSSSDLLFSSFFPPFYLCVGSGSEWPHDLLEAPRSLMQINAAFSPHDLVTKGTKMMSIVGIMWDDLSSWGGLLGLWCFGLFSCLMRKRDPMAMSSSSILLARLIGVGVNFHLWYLGFRPSLRRGKLIFVTKRTRTLWFVDVLF